MRPKGRISGGVGGLVPPQKTLRVAMFAQRHEDDRPHGQAQPDDDIPMKGFAHAHHAHGNGRHGFKHSEDGGFGGADQARGARKRSRRHKCGTYRKPKQIPPCRARRNDDRMRHGRIAKEK